MSAGFAKKIGMTRLFVDAKSVAVTAIQFQTNHIIQRKTTRKNGKNVSVCQLGAVNQKNVSQAELGHIKKHTGMEQGLRFVADFDLEMTQEKTTIEIADFAENDLISITGTTIGKGFTGAVKRWHFAGQPASHGHDHVRAVGSTGSRWPQRITVGKKMAGHHGAKGLTLRKVKIVAIDTEKSLIFVKGSIPGANSSYLKIAKEAVKSK